MKVTAAVVVSLVLAWLALWATNTGILVYSADTSFAVMRDCRYFIGISVLRRMMPLAERCPLIKKVGN